MIWAQYNKTGGSINKLYQPINIINYDYLAANNRRHIFVLTIQNI